MKGDRVKKLIERFPNLDFSSFKYTRSDAKSEVVCKKHGKFYQCYSELIRMKYGCKGCFKDREKVPQILTKVCEKHGSYSYKRYNSSKCHACNKEAVTFSRKQFLEELLIKNKHYKKGYFEVVGKYVNSSSRIRVKTIYGDCLVTPNHLLRGKRPTITSAINKTEFALEEFREVHGDIYKCPNFSYQSSKDPFYVICSKHGNFIKNYSSFKKSGCAKCAYEKLDIGFTREDFVRISIDREAQLYLVKIKHKKEEFLKIGITCRGIKVRLHRLDHEVIDYICSKDVGRIFDKEKYLHSILGKYKYRPTYKFQGYTECYNLKYLNIIRDEFRKV